jgi:hypothetical protein
MGNRLLNCASICPACARGEDLWFTENGGCFWAARSISFFRKAQELSDRKTISIETIFVTEKDLVKNILNSLFKNKKALSGA